MIYLVIVIFILCGLIGWMDYNNRKERKSMMNAILAKDNQELVNLNLADNTKLEVPDDKTPPDYLPTDALSDDEYEDIITKNIPKNG